MEKILTGGDWPVLFTQTIKELPWFPQIWSSYNGNGYGQNIAFVLGYKVFFALFSKLFSEVLHFPWAVTEKIIFFIPFWITVILSSYFLSKFFFKNKTSNLLSALIYSTNTYALMLVGGGQMGVALAYAFSPLVLLSFLKLFREKSLKRIVIASLFFGLLLCVDPRITGIIVLIVFIFLFFSFSIRKLFLLFSVLCLSALLNAFWIIPFLYSGTSGLSEAYTGTNILSFLSFANFENTISLLHPNWPDNIFGKVGFMRPEFLIIPILAFSSLLFVPTLKYKVLKKQILVLTLMSLLGAFLAKGIKGPAGILYFLLSGNVPGFIIYRDSTKWYSMIAISYGVMIPFFLWKLINFFQTTKKISILNFQFSNQLKNFQFTKQIILAIFIIFWGFTIRQLFLGQVAGTFQPKTIPAEYIRLENLLVSQNDFFRVLWVPQQSRFGYFSNTHPPVTTYDIITSHELLSTFKFLEKNSTQDFIENSAIKYVIVPYDPTGEIYITDRKYDSKIYEQFYARMKKISWLSQDKSFKNIGVFLVKNPKTLLYEAATGKEIKFNQNTLTKYTGSIWKSNNSAEIVFSQQYDPHWVLEYNHLKIISKPYKKMFNSFDIPPEASSFTLEYATQKWVNIGVIVSLAVLLALGLTYFKKR